MVKAVYPRKIGPKEAQVRELRQAKAAPSNESAGTTHIHPAITASVPALQQTGLAQAQESDVMRTTAKKKVADRRPVSQPKGTRKKVRAAKATRKAVSGKTTKKRKESKSDVAERMLCQPGGTTREELSKATGWKYVNLAVAAKRAGKALVEDPNTGRVRLV